MRAASQTNYLPDRTHVGERAQMKHDSVCVQIRQQGYRSTWGRKYVAAAMPISPSTVSTVRLQCARLLTRGSAVETRGDLIAQQDRRPLEQLHAERDSPLLPTRDTLDQHVPDLAVCRHVRGAVRQLTADDI